MNTITENNQELTTQRQTVTLSINVKKFMPNLLWVLSARSTDDNRDVLKYLNIDNNGFCCTDGRRLHLCSDVTCLPNGLEHGLYQVNICKDVIVFIPKDGTFPDYKAVIFEPETEPITLNFDFTKHDVGEKSSRYSTSIVKISQILNGESTVNIDFLKDMAGKFTARIITRLNLWLESIRLLSWD